MSSDSLERKEGKMSKRDVVARRLWLVAMIILLGGGLGYAAAGWFGALIVLGASGAVLLIVAVVFVTVRWLSKWLSDRPVLANRLQVIAGWIFGVGFVGWVLISNDRDAKAWRELILTAFAIGSAAAQASFAFAERMLTERVLLVVIVYLLYVIARGIERLPVVLADRHRGLEDLHEPF